MRTVTLIFICVMFFTQSGLSQKLKLDLSKEPGKVIQVKYDDKVISKIELVNALPKEEYEFTYEITRQILDPIDYTLPGGGAGIVEDDCQKLANSIKEAFDYLDIADKNEKEWAKKIKAVQDALDKSKCPPDEGTVEKAETLIQASRVTVPLNEEITIDRGETLTLYIVRGDSFWKFQVNGESVGQWFVHYSFGGTTPWRKYGEFHTEAIPDTTLFRVAKKEIRQPDIDFLPAVLFSFIPYKKYSERLFFSFTGGLGTDAEDIAVIGGLSAFFWNNLGVNLYVVGKNQPVLDGKYSLEGTSIVKENLDFDQLHEEKFRLHFGISLSFRFKDNPFEKKDDEEE